MSDEKNEAQDNSGNEQTPSDNNEQPIIIPSNELVIKGLKIEPPQERPRGEQRERNED